ncbi:RNA pyrophosphohydrolase [Oceanibacterium hippocampi]|uniref:RNA pyrophosphohydrolase n=1 Tax=Oceanibacterium hippocampi TaxID=745714 RepID=A0A1Y5RFJ1_9PROT|nr:RNA pyrophosphohydrolase [Oceanibacterium hippocampi]SLN13458.1 RNA pyrophosphohydrolase [Oceanibacterium hippocampi]
MTGNSHPVDLSHLPYRPCVAVMLLNQAGQVFVAQRIDQTAEAWQMPQGGIDAGETPRQALFRELEEEIGTCNAEILAESAGWYDYDLPAEIAARVWQGRYRGQRQKWFAMRFLGTDSEIRLDTPHPEFREWCWLDIAEAIDRGVSFKRDIYARVAQEFQHLVRTEPEPTAI